MRAHIKYSNTDNLTHAPPFVCSCVERKQKNITEKADENRLKTHLIAHTRTAISPFAKQHFDASL